MTGKKVKSGTIDVKALLAGDEEFLRALVDAVLDLSSLRHELVPFYSHTGRPSVDPELMLRMLLVGYCYGLRSERRFLQPARLSHHPPGPPTD